MSAPQRSGHGWARAIVIAIVIVWALVLIFPDATVGAFARWYGCQQLAPVERFFVRGC